MQGYPIEKGVPRTQRLHWFDIAQDVPGFNSTSSNYSDLDLWSACHICRNVHNEQHRLHHLSASIPGQVLVQILGNHFRFPWSAVLTQLHIIPGLIINWRNPTKWPAFHAHWRRKLTSLMRAAYLVKIPKQPKLDPARGNASNPKRVRGRSILSGTETYSVLRMSQVLTADMKTSRLCEYTKHISHPGYRSPYHGGYLQRQVRWGWNRRAARLLGSVYYQLWMGWTEREYYLNLKYIDRLPWWWVVELSLNRKSV